MGFPRSPLAPLPFFSLALPPPGLAGAGAGMVLGCIAILLLPAAQDAGGFLTGLGFRGLSWIWPLVVPPLAAGVAFWATGAAARRMLKDLP